MLDQDRDVAILGLVVGALVGGHTDRAIDVVHLPDHLDAVVGVQGVLPLGADAHPAVVDRLGDLLRREGEELVVPEPGGEHDRLVEAVADLLLVVLEGRHEDEVLVVPAGGDHHGPHGLRQREDVVVGAANLAILGEEHRVQLLSEGVQPPLADVRRARRDGHDRDAVDDGHGTDLIVVDLIELPLEEALRDQLAAVPDLLVLVGVRVEHPHLVGERPKLDREDPLGTRQGRQEVQDLVHRPFDPVEGNGTGEQLSDTQLRHVSAPPEARCVRLLSVRSSVT